MEYPSRFREVLPPFRLGGRERRSLPEATGAAGAPRRAVGRGCEFLMSHCDSFLLILHGT